MKFSGNNPLERRVPPLTTWPLGWTVPTFVVFRARATLAKSPFAMKLRKDSEVRFVEIHRGVEFHAAVAEISDVQCQIRGQRSRNSQCERLNIGCCIVRSEQRQDLSSVE